jgi:hypothetical protein
MCKSGTFYHKKLHVSKSVVIDTTDFYIPFAEPRYIQKQLLIWLPETTPDLVAIIMKKLSMCKENF